MQTYSKVFKCEIGFNSKRLIISAFGSHCPQQALHQPITQPTKRQVWAGWLDTHLYAYDPETYDGKLVVLLDNTSTDCIHIF